MNIRTNSRSIRCDYVHDLNQFISQFNRDNGIFFGAIVLCEYLRKDLEGSTFFDQSFKKDAIVISRFESSYPFLDKWQKNDYQNINDFTTSVATELASGENLDVIDVFTTDFSIANGFEILQLNKIIDLNILRIGYHNGYFKLFDETKEDIENKKMKFLLIGQSYKQFNITIENILFFERYHQFELEETNQDTWITILNTFPKQGFLQAIIEWNTKIKQWQSNQVPMFLITAKPKTNKNEKLTLKDLLITFRRYDLIHIWRIYWDELTVIEKLHPYKMTLFEDEETLQLQGKNVNINDFLLHETEFKQEIEINELPPLCFEILMFDENVDINEHIKEEKDAIVILKKLKNTFIAGCTTKTILKNSNLMFYQCTISEEQFENPERYTLQDKVFVRIDVFKFPFFISEENVEAIVNNTETNYFIVNETPQFLSFTMEKIAADKHTGAQQSGHHCQEGTEKQVSIVFPINVSNIMELNTKLQSKKIR